MLINNFIKYRHGLKLLAVLKFQNSQGMADFSSIPTSLIHIQNIILSYNVAQSFTVHPFSFFGMLQNLRKWGEICNIFNLRKSFFAI